MRLLIINGPNLNLLGERETNIYGTHSLDELMLWLETSSIGKKHQFKFYQSRLLYAPQYNYLLSMIEPIVQNVVKHNLIVQQNHHPVNHFDTDLQWRVYDGQLFT